MSERGSEKNISKEGVSKAITLSREISRIKVLDDKSPEANEKARNFLKGNFSTQYENVTRMVELSKDPGRTEDDPIKINAKKDLDLLGAAMLLAGQNKIEEWIIGAEVSSHLPSVFADIETVLANNLLVSGKNDQIGKKIVTQLEILEKANRRAALAPNSYEETRERETKKTIDVLLDKYDNVDSDSDDASKLGAVIGCLDDGLSKAAEKVMKNGKKIDNRDEEDLADAALIPVWEEQQRKAREKAKAEGNEENYKSPMWLMSKEDVVDEEMQQRGKQQFHLSPPYPHWFKELSQDQKDLWRVRCKLINGVAWKQIIRNKDVEKLMTNEAIDLTRAELKLLYEMPHFKDALKTYFDDLFEGESPEGKNMLRIKREKGPVGTRGEILAVGVEEKLTHFQAYKEKMALRMQYPGKDDKWYINRYEEYTKTSNEKDAAKKLLASDEYRGAVASAWSFLYIGNTIESADVDRQLKPSEPVSDKLRSMIHPLQKAMGKWGIYKEGSTQGHKGIYNDDEKPGEYDKVTGDEEPMGGPVAGWVKYHLEMDDIKGIDYAHSFRKKLADHEPGYRPFPERMATSLIEMLKVNIKDANGDLIMERDNEGKKLEKPLEVPMSLAILKGMEITFDVVKVKDSNGNYIKETKSEAIRKGHAIISHEYEGHDWDTCVGFRDAMDGCCTAYNYLTGKIKPDKSAKDWSLGFDKDIALVRQNSTKYYNGSEKLSYLKFVDNPEFIAWVIAGSFGMELPSEKIVLDFKGSIPTFRDGYYNSIKGIVNLVGLTKLGVDKGLIMSYLSAPDSLNTTYWGLGNIQKEILKNEKLRDRYIKNNRPINNDEW